MRVTGIFENHVYNYVILTPETIAGVTGEADANGAYVNFAEGEDVYQAQTAPLLDYYSHKGNLQNVDGNRDVKVVFADVQKLMEKL